MKLRERYFRLQNDTTERFNELRTEDFDFTLNKVEDFDEEYKKEIKELLEKENFNSLEDYDFLYDLEQIFYYTNKGDERMCYLLKVNSNGIYVLDSEHYITYYLELNQLSDFYSKMLVIESMESLTKI